MQFFSNLAKFFDTVTAELTKIAIPAMAMIIVAIGFMWISGDRGAEKGKSWIFKLVLIFFASICTFCCELFLSLLSGTHSF